MAMNKNYSKLSRRWFLKGAGGVTLGLPLLDASRARGADPGPLKFALFVVGSNVERRCHGGPESQR
jgi:hypothetical protein